MKKKYYIAYGSNLDTMQMKFRCPGARPIGVTFLPNHELLFKGSKTGSYLTVEPCEGSSVACAVWEVTQQDEQNLDRYEGYPDFYYKEELEVNVQPFSNRAPKPMTVFIYKMHEERPLGKPSKQYLETCLRGYRNFGFDITRLFDAYSRSVQEERL